MQYITIYKGIKFGDTYDCNVPMQLLKIFSNNLP